MKKSFILFIGALLLIVCMGFSYTNKDPVVEGLDQEEPAFYKAKAER